MREVFRAVSYLHSCNIMHRDIKPENFMVDAKTQSLKLIDFGQAIEIQDG
jgi:serine/threonine protein kinase